MNKVELPPSVLNCLKNEMQIEMDHFFDKYNSFDDSFKSMANNLLLNMLTDSKKEGSFDGDTHYYEEGSDEENEFMQVMFDCFNVSNKYKGLELHQELYAHPSRGGDAWFPIVIISSPIDSYPEQPAKLTVYRGCSLKSFEDKSYRDRQSWTTDFDTAKAFAFNHYGFDKEDRVVINTTVSDSDIFWMRAGEREVVLNPRFTPLSDVIKLDYEQCNQGG